MRPLSNAAVLRASNSLNQPVTSLYGTSDENLQLIHSWYLIDGLRIHCVEAGVDTKNTPIILLHGLGDSHLTWRQIVPDLARDRRVLIPDLPGHGLSDRPDVSYELSWYSRIMMKFLLELGMTSVDLIGHSFGGGIAQMMLLESRERIRRIALLASGGLGREISPLLRLASLPYVVEYLGQPFMRLGTEIFLRIVGDCRPSEDIAALSFMNGRPDTARAFARTVRDLMDLRAQRYTFYQRAHEIADLPPIRVYWGNQDNIIPINHGQKMAQNLSGVDLVVFDSCGHFLHQEQPELAARALKEFLNEGDLPPARLCDLNGCET